MHYKLSFSLAIFFSCTLTLHSKNLQKENTKKLLIEHLESINQIMLKAPYAIKKYEKGKLYLDDFYINQVGLSSTII